MFTCSLFAYYYQQKSPWLETKLTKSLGCLLGCGKQVPELQALLCCPTQPVSETSRMSSNPTTQLCLVYLQAVEIWRFGVGFGLSGSAPSFWEWHQLFRVLGFTECHKTTWDKWQPLLDMLVHTYWACRQQTVDPVIVLQMSMNKTYIDMHIKKQELTKKHTAKQSCSACERRHMEWTYSKSLT